MRVSELYKLGRSQGTLDFIDVDVFNDTPVFISPRAVGLLPSEWAEGCVYRVRTFFEVVLNHIQRGQHRTAEALLQQLREPNETHLGLSVGKSAGRALGEESARKVWSALSRSEAARSGLLKDLEDTVLMVRGISVDIISDMTTNIIREALITYTQEACEMYGIPLVDGVRSGPLWDPISKRWFDQTTQLPIAGGKRLLLVPKAIVRQKLEYDAGEYYTHFLLEHLRQVELSANSSLVELLKNGGRRVTKAALKKKYGIGKDAIVRESLRHPSVLAEYKKSKDAKPVPPLSHEVLARVEKIEEPGWDALLAAVTKLRPGNDDAGAYEKAIEALLTALFYPNLTNPKPQHQLHAGRKRVDIAYTNMGLAGFFHWLSLHYSAAHVFIECKNYSREVENPELDQIAGRFSPSRGQVGIIVCRSSKDKKLFQQRCRDTASDGRGFILALDDTDLAALIRIRRDAALYADWDLLRSRFAALVS